MLKWIAFVLLFASLANGATSAPTTKPLTADAVLRFVDETIDWYHRVDALDPASQRQSHELLLRENVRDDAIQAVRLSLQFAHAQAAALEPGASAATSGQARNLAQIAAKASERVTGFQAQIDQLDKELATTQPASRPALVAQRDRISAQIELAKAQRDIMKQYSGFVANAQTDTASLTQKLQEIEQSVPEVSQQAATTRPADEAAAAAQNETANSSGILSILRDLFTISSRMSEISDAEKQAKAISQRADQFHGPIRADIIDAIHRANALGAATQPENDASAIDAQRREIESLTTRFKALAAAAVPLDEQRVICDAAATRLGNWHDLLSREYRYLLRELFMHIAVVGIAVVMLIVISELWRRATYRYVADIRRRRQLMVVRRIVIAAIVTIIIIASVVSEFGSLATFAGLITAGIAVALQTVILSGVAYFFFIGRFGVRVGDRVTISGITGDVVEIGIFRLYLMELAGESSDLHRTGRIVVFSNSVLFQPTAFYKQMPGANYAWRQVRFTLSPQTDYNLAQKRLLEAVEPVFAEYRDRLETQQAAVSASLHIPMDAPKPQGRLRFIDDGVEFILRYPVELGKAPEIDDAITRKLIDAINREPKLKLVAPSTPTIQPAT